MKQIARHGGAIPEGMQDQPEVQLGGALYWRAFWDLCSCRDVDVPIPWRDTQYWAEVYGLDDEMRETLHVVIREMDKEFLAYIAEQRKREQELQAANNPQAPAAPAGRAPPQRKRR